MVYWHRTEVNVQNADFLLCKFMFRKFINCEWNSCRNSYCKWQACKAPETWGDV